MHFVSSQGTPLLPKFFSESVLYLRFSPQPTQAKLYYIGSTEKCTTARERTRFRKHKQAVEERLVSAELALRYWAVVPISEQVTRRVAQGRGAGSQTYPATSPELSFHCSMVLPETKHPEAT